MHLTLRRVFKHCSRDETVRGEDRTWTIGSAFPEEGATSAFTLRRAKTSGASVPDRTCNNIYIYGIIWRGAIGPDRRAIAFPEEGENIHLPSDV